MLHILPHVLGHLLLQHVQQFLEHLLGIRVHEVVLHQLLNLTAQAVGQVVQLFAVPVRPLLKQVQQVLLHGPVFVRRLADLFSGLVHPPVDALPLGAQDFVKPLLQVVHHRIHVVLLQLLTTPVPKHVHQFPKAGHLLAVAVLHSVAHQFPQGFHDVALLQQFVRQAVHQLVGVDVEDFLGAVPLGVAVGAVEEHRGLPVPVVSVAGDIGDDGKDCRE